MKKSAKKEIRKEGQMGATRVEIDWKLLERTLERFGTLEDVACVLGCSEDTIQRRVKEKYDVTFAVYSKKKRAKGRMSLRVKQFEVAMDGNVSMLIWLGKNHLEQSDRQDMKIKADVDGNVTFNLIELGNGDKSKKKEEENGDSDTDRNED